MITNIHNIRPITDNYAQHGKETIPGEIISYFCRQLYGSFILKVVQLHFLLFRKFKD